MRHESVGDRSRPRVRAQGQRVSGSESQRIRGFIGLERNHSVGACGYVDNSNRARAGGTA